MAKKVDIHLKTWKSDVVNLDRQIRPDECDSKYLDELNFILNANVKNYDPDSVKRKKVANAIQNQKFRGCFNLDVKIRLDTITGYSSRILDNLPSFGTDDRILLSDGGTTDQQAIITYWSIMGCDGLDLNQGMALVGEHEVFIKVNIFIDLHQGINTDVLSADTVKRCVADLNDVIPAYIFVYLGYVDSLGLFQQYAEIG